MKWMLLFRIISFCVLNHVTEMGEKWLIKPIHVNKILMDSE